MKKIVFSGIQPSGSLHIGNYIGVIQQWIKLQDTTEAIFCIVDLHAITIPQDPNVLREKILEVTALYLACGIDSQKAKIFVQSENPDHTYLSWIFDCLLPFGSLLRMTQFKEKTLKQREHTSVGLFNYPSLMAADILLYDADEVPVGEDQKQHIELARDVGQKFNKTFGEVFKLPHPLIQKETARIMSLANPLSKMSKSDKDPLGVVNLLDSKDVVIDKVKKAVTDSGAEIVMRDDKPEISNLLVIYSSISGISVTELEQKYKGEGYAKFKNDLAELLGDFLSNIQSTYREIRGDERKLREILNNGRAYAVERSSKKITQVNKVMGLGRS